VDDALFPHLKEFKTRAEGPDTLDYKIGEIFGEIKNKFQSGCSLRDALEYIDELRFRSQAEKHELSHLYEAKIMNMGNVGRSFGKTNPLNDNDLAEFVELQINPTESDKSWITNIVGIGQATFDLSVCSPSDIVGQNKVIA